MPEHRYKTFMERSGYNIGLSMIEVMASRLHQDFYLGSETVDDVIQAFIVQCPDVSDLMQLKAEIEFLLSKPGEKAKRKRLHKLGMSYWPVDRPIADALNEALVLIDRRLAE